MCVLVFTHGCFFSAESMSSSYCTVCQVIVFVLISVFSTVSIILQRFYVMYVFRHKSLVCLKEARTSAKTPLVCQDLKCILIFHDPPVCCLDFFLLPDSTPPPPAVGAGAAGTDSAAGSAAWPSNLCLFTGWSSFWCSSTPSQYHRSITTSRCG